MTRDGILTTLTATAAYPSSLIQTTDNSLYGITAYGGNSDCTNYGNLTLQGCGTAFKLSGAISPTAPRITTLNQSRANFGDSVVLVGTNFTGVTSVTFSGIAASFTINSGTQITATVPPGATSGAIQVTNANGTGVSLTRFLINPTAVRTRGWQQSGTGDFNKDGKPDLLWRNYTTGTNQVWFMDGGAYLGQADFLTVSDPNWQLIAAADFTQDGQPDLLWRNFTTGQNAVWQMNGTAYVQSFDIGSVTDLNWQLSGIGDLTNDGQPDLIWRNYRTGDIYLWRMDGYSYQEAYFMKNVADPYWQLVGVADLTQDGRNDLLWRYWEPRGAGDVYLWQMDGYTYQKSLFIDYVRDLNYQLTGVADFTRDGQPDLVWSNNLTGDNYLWQMDGYTYTKNFFLGPKPI